MQLFMTSLKMAKRVTLKKGNKMKIERRTIQPATARTWLEKHNTRNRFLSKTQAERLAQAQRNGEWQFNGQPIQFALDGTLLDGQHRLLACVLSDIAMESLVIWGVDSDSQHTMDMGKPRSVADILALEGYGNHFALAALAKRIALYKAKGLRYALHQANVQTPGEILREARELTNPQRYLGEAKAVARVLRLNPTVVGLFMWITDQIDQEDSEFFWGHLRSGVDLSEGQAVYALRVWATDPSRDTMTNNSQSRTTHGAIIAKAWNKFRAGETVVRLTFRMGGSNPETFPELI
jgi:hypothetical protein